MLAGQQDNHDAHRVLKEKLDKVAIYNTIVMTQTNCGYLPFAENWLFHIKRLNLTNYVIISEDSAATSYLEQRHADHVISAELLSATRPKLGLDQNQFHDFGSAHFVQLACARPVYMAGILELGFNILWVDLDAALLIDPFKYIPWLYEYVGVDDALDSKLRDSGYLCTCFMFLRPTDRVKQLLSEWRAICESQGREAVGNQLLFNKVMRSRQNATVPLDYYILPKQLYPDGWNMRRAGNEGCSRFWRAPAWSHANYIKGFDKKREHFKHLGLWHGGPADETPQC